jgi:hypothetical protein
MYIQLKFRNILRLNIKSLFVDIKKSNLKINNQEIDNNIDKGLFESQLQEEEKILTNHFEN